MASDEQPITIGDVAKIKHGFAFKGDFFSEHATTYVLVTPGNFSIGGGFQLGKPKFYAGPIQGDYVLSEGDLIVTMTDLSKASDTLGYTAKVPATPGVTYLHNQRVGLVQMRSERKVRREWLNYAMRTEQYRAWIIGSASGTTVKHTSPSRIESFAFVAPPIGQQVAAAELLGALERSMENLREANTTLEAIAHTLFKSWFVDFDPVLAKAEGRGPEGMDAATAALFPSEFEDSESGPIPKGWRRVRFGDIAAQIKGSVNPLASPSRVFHHYSLPAFDAGQLPIAEAGESIKSNKTAVPTGAVLVSKLNPHIPRIWFVGEVDDNAVCSTEFLVWRPRKGVGSAFVYCLAASSEFNSAMRQLVTGTSNSHQRVKPDQLAGIQAAVVSDSAMIAFENIAAPLLSQVARNRRRAATLAETRDTLLPRLISGKLRLPEAEAEIRRLA